MSNVYVVVRTIAGFSRESPDQVDVIAVLTDHEAAGAIAKVVGGQAIMVAIDYVPPGIQVRVDLIYGRSRGR